MAKSRISEHVSESEWMEKSPRDLFVEYRVGLVPSRKGPPSEYITHLPDEMEEPPIRVSFDILPSDRSVGIFNTDVEITEIRLLKSNKKLDLRNIDDDYLEVLADEIAAALEDEYGEANALVEVLDVGVENLKNMIYLSKPRRAKRTRWAPPPADAANPLKPILDDITNSTVNGKPLDKVSKPEIQDWLDGYELLTIDKVIKVTPKSRNFEQMLRGKL